MATIVSVLSVGMVLAFGAVIWYQFGPWMMFASVVSGVGMMLIFTGIGSLLRMK